MTIPGPLLIHSAVELPSYCTWFRLWNISFQMLDPSLELALARGQVRAPTCSTAHQQQDNQMIIIHSPHLTTAEQGQAREQEQGLFQLNQLISCIRIPPA